MKYIPRQVTQNLENAATNPLKYTKKVLAIKTLMF